MLSRQGIAFPFKQHWPFKRYWTGCWVPVPSRRPFDAERRSSVRPRWSVPGGPSPVVRPRWSVPGGPSPVVRPRWSVPGGPGRVETKTEQEVQMTKFKFAVVLLGTTALIPLSAMAETAATQTQAQAGQQGAQATQPGLTA